MQKVVIRPRGLRREEMEGQVDNQAQEIWQLEEWGP